MAGGIARKIRCIPDDFEPLSRDDGARGGFHAVCISWADTNKEYSGHSDLTGTSLLPTIPFGRQLHGSGLPLTLSA